MIVQSSQAIITVNYWWWCHDDDDRETIVEYLKENTPDFNEFKFKPWDDETKKRVLKVLSQYGSVGSDIKKVMNINDDDEEVIASKKKVVLHYSLQ